MMRKFVHDESFDGEFSDYGGGFTPTNILGWIEDSSLAPFIDGNAVFHRNWPYSLVINGAEPSDENDRPASARTSASCRFRTASPPTRPSTRAPAAPSPPSAVGT